MIYKVAERFWNLPLGALIAGVSLGGNLGCGSKAQFHGGAQRSEPTPLPPPPEPETPEPKSLDQVPPPPIPVVEPAPPPEPDIVATPSVRAVDWYWTCDAEKDQKSIPTSSEELVVLKDQGDHPISYDPAVPTTFKFMGRVCPPSQLDRDIVFVVDVSGSMDTNDPRIVDSCARLEGMQSILKTLTNRPGQNPEAVRFGVITFSSSLMTYSTGLYGSSQKFFDDLARSGKPADVLCEAVGGTNYESGIVKAAELLKGGRVGATKEVYLISDGQPTEGQDGIVLATQLKTTGVVVAPTPNSPNSPTPVKVTFATLMLKGVDTVMESKLASRDINGKPLHAFVQKAQDLGASLGSLAESNITKAELRVTQLAADGGTQVKSIDMMPYLKSFDFGLPPIKIDWVGPGSKLKVDVIYSDTHGRIQEKHGNVLQK